MKYNRISAIVNSTGEVISLYSDGEFKNFEKIRAIFGKNYDDVNDGLMDGPDVNGWKYTEKVYEFGEEVESVTFIYSKVTPRYIVVSYKPGSDIDKYYKIFDDIEKAKAFLYTEEYDFRERELYDCTENLSEDFVNDWCLPADYDEAEANDRGYFGTIILTYLQTSANHVIK